MTIQRISALQEIIKKNGLSALIFWRPDELVMLLGYMPLWGLSVFVYTGVGDPVLYVPELEPKDTLPLNIQVNTFPWGILDCVDPWADLYQKIKADLALKKIQYKPVSFITAIGGTAPCRMSAEQPPLPADLAGQLAKVSDGGFRDVSEELVMLYSHKTRQDIQGIKLTHKVVAAAIKTFYTCIHPGISEAELAGRIESSVQRFLEKDGITFAKAWPLVLSGPNAIMGGIYNRTTGRRLLEAELVMLEMSVCVNGYWADITRTAITSQVSSEKEALFQVVHTAQQKALDMMGPGIRMSEIDAAARNYIKSAGYESCFNHNLGHHVGFRYHDPGPLLNPSSEGILETGMVLTVEPGIYGKEINAGIRIEDNILITNNGYEILSAYPRGLSI